MENYERLVPKQPYTHLLKELRQVEKGQVVQFLPSGVRLFEQLETGKEATYSIDDGETEKTITIPERRMMLIQEAPLLSDLSISLEPKRFGMIHYGAPESQEFLEWKDTLVTPEEVYLSAQLMAVLPRKYPVPTIHVLNDKTGKSDIVSFDLARLLASHRATASWNVFGNTYK